MTGAIGVMALIAGFCWEASLTAEGIVGKLIAVAVSALAAVAAVGVAIWAALPTVSSHGVRMSRTDCATAGPGGRANSGFSGPAKRLSLRACLRTQVAAGWAVAAWRARRRVMTMIMAQ
jgi:hypothetical protein